MGITQLLAVLKARRTLLFGVWGGVVLLALLVSLILPRQYAATAEVVVESRGSDPLAPPQGVGLTTPGFLVTQADIIASERVGARAVAALKLMDQPRWAERWQKASGGQGDPARWIAGKLKKTVKVSPSHESNVLTITVTADDPAFAANYANALAKAYLETDLELKIEPAREYATWFDEHTKVLRANLEQAQSRLSAFQREHGLVGDEKLDLESARLGELSSQFTAVQAQSTEATERQRQGGGANEVASNPLIQALKVDLARQEAKLTELSGYLGENHPQYQRTKSEVESLRARLRQETGNVAAMVGTNSRISQAREGDLKGRLDAQKQRVLALKQQRDEMMLLQREVDSAQKAYDLVMARLTQTSLESKARQGNVALLSSAVAPTEASSPKVLLNVGLALVIGALLGLAVTIVRELFDRRVRAAGDLADALGVPLVVEVKAAPAAAAGARPFWPRLRRA
ncbi:MAG TPA: chain length determinant protein EpsF [Zoogloea sp.]|uniref:chain length determinant protein EpsF n=1 Tax=Zoogloea sp. TaxID=49181 RepID=UPI002CCAD3E1|nr:chain length determinant protein EpsF [Zoogloea sp.]HMV64661.1 chain length determinant protein EpsF [Rhodocyclaceae bacterium]HNA67008.1 chain length determinant protein EpsF [Rhodocyclaceae bacterium]HNB63471.1 chain length determinant protein EpsF [Rhodocyclaceae bacterium]HNC77881.1 chain length determinant protein EpsF [Rhodocyclaceae bacterium]HND24279.1 chain length determinant protein EpsF [Rhodocyclaceae bacterium]